MFGFMAEFEPRTLDDLWKCNASSGFKAILEADQDRTITHISKLLKLGGGQQQTTFPNVSIALRIIPDVISNIITREKLSMEHHISGQVHRIWALLTECQVLREIDIDDFDQLKCWNLLHKGARGKEAPLIRPCPPLSL
ncbi:hypothetical protein DPMN_004102 [Dreissena polymorpha]|uniref:Uncharacterized protein n=1 Tax=Dreissena polymorpha TaxID=45954 RepID=A0A9D4MM79_DREPO|nr:hypothetical protein DPMN_004102 [Dreissena polymorpha]